VPRLVLALVLSSCCVDVAVFANGVRAGKKTKKCYWRC
jgi:hypothetical protein